MVYADIIGQQNAPTQLKEMVAMTKQIVGIKKPLQILVHEDNENCLSQAGFALVRTTYFAAWTLKNIREASENQCYRQVNNLTTEEKIQYIKLVKGNYEHSHLMNPIRNLGLQEWEKLIFAEDLLDEETLLIFNQRIRAYIQCHSSAQPTKVEIGWVGQDLSEDCVSIYQLMRKKDF